MGSQQSAGASSITGGAGGIASGGSAAVSGGALNTGGSASSNGGVTGGVSTSGGGPMTGGAPPSGGSAAGGLGSGGNPSSGGSSPATGGSSPATGGTLSVAGSSSTGGASGAPSGVHSRVAFIDPGTNRFVAYDSEGQVVHDYSSLLDFGSSFDERTICIGRSAKAWDTSTTSAYFAAVSVASPGKLPELTPSEIFVRARRVGAGSVTVRIANTAGTVTDEFSVAGDFRVFESSPTREFILGEVAGFTGVLIRRSTHAVVWQGDLFQAAFSPDDKYLIVSVDDVTNGLVIVETNTGRTTNVNLATLPAGFSTASSGLISVSGAFNGGAIVTVARADYSGEALFWVNWDGSIRPLDASLPKDVTEYVFAANADDTRFAWWRIGSASVPVEPSLLGWFEFDLGSSTNSPLPSLSNTSSDCYDKNVATYYKIKELNLLSCACETGQCKTFAAIAQPADSGWQPTFTLSPRRGIVGYRFEWPLNRMPLSTSTSALFSADGTSLLQAEDHNFQWFQFDRLDELVLATGKILVSATTGHSTTLGGPNTIVMYE